MINDQRAAAAAAKAKAEEATKVAFDRFMSRDETKLMVSMIPATEPRELLVTLVRSAFHAGYGNGVLHSMDMMLNDILRHAGPEAS